MTPETARRAGTTIAKLGVIAAPIVLAHSLQSRRYEPVTSLPLYLVTGFAILGPLTQWLLLRSCVAGSQGTVSEAVLGATHGRRLNATQSFYERDPAWLGVLASVCVTLLGNGLVVCSTGMWSYFVALLTVAVALAVGRLTEIVARQHFAGIATERPADADGANELPSLRGTVVVRWGGVAVALLVALAGIAVIRRASGVWLEVTALLTLLASALAALFTRFVIRRWLVDSKRLSAK